MDIKGTVDAFDVINYVNSNAGNVITYFIVCDERSTWKFKRIKTNYIYVDSSCCGTSIRGRMVSKAERFYGIVDLPMCMSRETIERSWVLVPNNYGTGLDTEIFDGMIFIDKNIDYDLNLNRNITATIIFFNTSKITFDDTLDVVKIRHTHDDFENTANKFLSQYANKIRDEMNVLDSELLLKKAEYEMELEDMRNEHECNIELLNSEHDYEISLIENEHECELLHLQNEHEKNIEKIKSEHERELKLLEKLINFVTTD